MSTANNSERSEWLSLNDFEALCEGKKIYKSPLMLFCFETGASYLVRDWLPIDHIPFTNVDSTMYHLFDYVKKNSDWPIFSRNNWIGWTFFSIRNANQFNYMQDEIPQDVETISANGKDYHSFNAMQRVQQHMKMLRNLSKSEWYDRVKSYIDDNEDTLLDRNDRLYPDRLSQCPELQEYTDTNVFTAMKEVLSVGKQANLEYFKSFYPAFLFEQVKRGLKLDYSYTGIENEALAQELWAAQIQVQRDFFLARMSLIVDDRIEGSITDDDMDKHIEELWLDGWKLRLAGDKILSHCPPWTNWQDALTKGENYAVQKTTENTEIYDSAVRALIKQNDDLVIASLNSDRAT